MSNTYPPWKASSMVYHCVVTPFLDPIAKKDRLEQHVLKGIKNALDQLYRTQEMFSKDDVSWRHVSMYGNHHLVRSHRFGRFRRSARKGKE